MKPGIRTSTYKMAVTLRTENIQTTLCALNNDFAGRFGSSGYEPTRTIHVHRRNRAFVWKIDMQEKLLDSILKGYYVPPIICCSRIIDGVERREVMEGGNRITTVRKILNNEVRVITESERNTVSAHPITLVVMRGLSNSQQREMFRRLNKSIKVSDGQLYAMSEEDSPLVKEAFALLDSDEYPLRARINSTFFVTKGADNDGKKNLENAVALVSGALNGVHFITKSFTRQEEMVESQAPIDRDKVVTTLGLLLDIFRMADEIERLDHASKKKAQWPVGKYLGAMLYDILTNRADVSAVQQKWVNYLTCVRRAQPQAEEAISASGAQNINVDKLKRTSVKVNIFVTENRIASEDEIKLIKHADIEESEDGEEVVDE